jgi:DNA-binding response OmpR family regulator
VTPENVNSIIDSQKVLQQQSNYLITIQQKLENSLGLYHIQRTMLILAVVIILLLVVALFLLWKGIHSIREANHKKTQAIKEQTLFYTNARHQLRTPLTLISGPLREIEQDGNLMGQDKKLLDVVLRNVRVLEDIVTGTLNFDTRKQKVVDDVAAVQARQEMQRDIQESNKDIILKTDSDELSTILIVDDNVDMRSYLRTILTSQYYVIEASDGQSGLQLARESVPNLIVSDVMMPVMSGLSFCRKIKEDALTSHIPVILLTARSTEQQQIEGFEHGADAYITKPFNAQFLLVRITNLLQSRMQLRKLFKEKMEESQESAHDIQVEMSTPDRRFLDALREAIYKRMNDTHLKMDDLGADMNISRVQLYRKVKALTGVSPAELLRQIRMQQAYKLLHTTDKTIQEIAYEIGFGTPGYFSSCFKKQYGKYPTELRK